VTARKVVNWLKRPAVMLTLIGLVLPNLAFLLLSLVGISVPPRTLPMTLYLLAAASTRFLPGALVAVAYIGALVFDIMYCATQLFGLTLTEALFALQFINELDILSSNLYVVLIVLLGTVFGLAFYLLLCHGKTLRRASWTPMLGLGLALLPIDVALNTPADSAFWLSVGREPPFESGVAKSGFLARAEQADGRHMVVVIVEAMGHFADPKMQGLLEAAIRSGGIGARYEIASGTSTFIGGTTAAEMREFCATRDSYLDYRTQPRRDCLPFLMAEQGYAVSGYHGFSKDMFERGLWWPQIGLAEAHFGEDLLQPGEKKCGDVFVGVCDPKLVRDIARRIAEADKPQFTYLLTFNTHVPVIVDTGYHHLDCEKGDARVPEREVCIMTDGWIELLETIAESFAAPGVPPTEILIVGDHAPPLWYRKARDLFTSGQVTWFHLSPKG
jgi:hypothetical protein